MKKITTETKTEYVRKNIMYCIAVIDDRRQTGNANCISG